MAFPDKDSDAEHETESMPPFGKKAGAPPPFPPKKDAKPAAPATAEKKK